MISDICNTSRGGMLQSTDTLLLYLCWLFSVFLLWCETNKQFIGICSLDFSGIFDLLEYLFLWKLFTFHDYISSQISALSTPYIFQTDYHSSFIAFKMIIFHHSTRHGITRLISTVHIMHNRHSETKQRKKQDRTDMGRKRVLVSCNCRDLSAPHSYSSPPQILPPRDNLPTQNVDIWQSENETQQPTIFVVCLGSAQTNHPLSLIVLT